MYTPFRIKLSLIIQVCRIYIFCIQKAITTPQLFYRNAINIIKELKSITGFNIQGQAYQVETRATDSATGVNTNVLYTYDPIAQTVTSTSTTLAQLDGSKTITVVANNIETVVHATSSGLPDWSTQTNFQTGFTQLTQRDPTTGATTRDSLFNQTTGEVDHDISYLPNGSTIVANSNLHRKSNTPVHVTRGLEIHISL